MTWQDKVRFALLIFSIVPIVLGFLCWTWKNFSARYLTLFLAYGLLSDIAVGVLYTSGLTDFSHHIFSLYLLAEPPLLFYFFLRQCTLTWEKNICLSILTLTLVPWILNYQVLYSSQHELPDGSHQSIFMALSAIVSAYFLLKVTEIRNTGARNDPRFWFLTAIFFFNFCTFFVMTFTGKEVAQKFWWVFNLMNVISSVFYSIGFLIAIRYERATVRG